MTAVLDRRRFLQAIAASVVAASAPLPIGFSEEPNWLASGEIGHYEGFRFIESHLLFEYVPKGRDVVVAQGDYGSIYIGFARSRGIV